MQQTGYVFQHSQMWSVWNKGKPEIKNYIMCRLNITLSSMFIKIIVYLLYPTLHDTNISQKYYQSNEFNLGLLNNYYTNELL